jgi:hypothetical protein
MSTYPLTLPDKAPFNCDKKCNFFISLCSGMTQSVELNLEITDLNDGFLQGCSWNRFLSEYQDAPLTFLKLLNQFLPTTVI